MVVGGDGSGWVGPGGDNTKVYNNTFVDIPDASVFGEIILNGSSTEARNNLFYDTGGTSITAATVSNTVTPGSDPFVSVAGDDFHLSGAQAGGTLSSPYNEDLDGVTRGADGTFDVGALEYEA